MGVSLERVQFKFASIVGELCSEPDVLSQFAVWLDLRLAEYKLKGAISLDCSGDEPEATWMRGLNKCKRCALKSQSDRQQKQHYTPQSPVQGHVVQDSQYAEQVFSSNERISPDIVVVKNEDDIVPVEFQTSQVIETSPKQQHRRKRSGPYSDNWQKDFLSTPSKQRRMWSAGDSPSNQSLMSVIGNYRDETPETSAKGKSATVIEKEDGNSSVTHGAINSPLYSDEEKPSTSVDWPHPANSDTLNASSLNSYSYSEIGEGDLIGGELGPPAGNVLSATNRSRKMRIRNIDQLPKRTVINMVAGVGSFERWLWEQPFGDYRSIVDIPPPQLDKYLALFFGSVTTPSGNNYKAESFQSLKVSIDRYLQETGYPESPRTSDTFRNSLAAYRARRKELILESRDLKDTSQQCNSNLSRQTVE